MVKTEKQKTKTLKGCGKIKSLYGSKTHTFKCGEFKEGHFLFCDDCMIKNKLYQQMEGLTI